MTVHPPASTSTSASAPLPPAPDLWRSFVRVTKFSWHDFSPAGERVALARVAAGGLHLIVPLLALLSGLTGFLAFANHPRTDVWGLSLGTAAIVYMSWSFILASRLGIVHHLFGGFDRSYIWHRWFAVLAVVALVLHADADNEVQNAVLPFGEDLEELGTELAEVAEVIVIVLVVFSVLRFLPYGLWKLSHKLMIVPYLFSAFHFLSAEKPFSITSGWGLWFSAFLVAGILLYGYRLLWVDLSLADYRYRVVGVELGASETGLRLEPVGRRRMPHRSGQFAFVRATQFPFAESQGFAESHPFSIASAPTETELRFVARHVGDWTRSLGSTLTVDDRVLVSGPHGNLRLIEPGAAGHLWLAAGSGITPFLSVGDDLAALATPPVLIYSFRGTDSAIGLAQLRAWNASGLIRLIEHDSTTLGRFDAARLRDVIVAGPPGVHLAVCGPFDFIRQAQGVARKHGVRSFDFEMYDYRSGYGPNFVPLVDQMLRSVGLVSDRGSDRGRDRGRRRRE